MRRLMFWHGRNQGHKSVFFIIMKLYVSFYHVITVLVSQTMNGMSAVNDLDSLMLALFAVCFVNYYITAWQTASFDVDQRLKEKDLPFKTSDLYAYCRRDIQNFYRFYAYAMIFVIVPSVIVKTSLFFGEANGAIDESGK
mmetsp:Transcript_36145/g.44087  ORF Transcript_36145/g.44087 Transcript_36145/m.44087 type:complete len:140 (+) Transcript_36145:1385-1804(+)